MELSGNLIKGTGSYVISEIAPPSESGQLLTNGDFSAWTADDPDGWTVAITGGENAANFVSQYGSENKLHIKSDGTLVRIYQTQLTIGRHYKIIVKIDSISGLFKFIDSGGYASDTISTTGVHELFFKAAGTVFYFTRNLAACEAVVDYIYLEEVPEGYPLMEKGDKYLECTSDGSIAFPSTQAYGEWEFDMYKGNTANSFRFNFINNLLDVNGESYSFLFFNTEYLALQRRGLYALLMQTNIVYLENTTWYRIKITRTIDGEFSLYVKGGAFGTDDWTLVTVTSGSNPTTDALYTKSEYAWLFVQSGDRIANLVMRPAVRQ